MSSQTTRELDLSPILLPCPFCGSSDVRLFPSSTRRAMGLGSLIECANDDCTAAVMADTEAQVIKRWNRRLEISNGQ